MVINHPRIMRRNVGIIKKRLNPDSTILLQDQALDSCGLLPVYEKRWNLNTASSYGIRKFRLVVIVSKGVELSEIPFICWYIEIISRTTKSQITHCGVVRWLPSFDIFNHRSSNTSSSIRLKRTLNLWLVPVWAPPHNNPNNFIPAKNQYLLDYTKHPSTGNIIPVIKWCNAQNIYWQSFIIP